MFKEESKNIDIYNFFTAFRKKKKKSDTEPK